MAHPVQVVFEKDLHQLRHGESLPGHFVYDKTHDGWLLYLGEKHSEYAGDQECLLRYSDKQAYESDADSKARYIPDESQWKMRTTLCTSGAGTGVNDASHKPQSRYGDAAAGRGNCRDQIRVSDRYGRQAADRSSTPRETRRAAAGPAGRQRRGDRLRVRVQERLPFRQAVPRALRSDPLCLHGERSGSAGGAASLTGGTPFYRTVGTALRCTSRRGNGISMPSAASRAFALT